MGKISLKIAVLGGVLIAISAGMAYAALVRVNGIILKAEGSFTPSVLPRRAYAPVTIQGHVNISTPSHGVPPAMTQLNLNFSHEGKVETKGLPTCQSEQLLNTTPSQARSICKGAIVGTGTIEALVRLPGKPQVPVRTPLTIFNGPPVGGSPTVIFHSYNPFPSAETFVVTAPILAKKFGAQGFHVNLEVPPIAGGYGSITHGDIKIGRKYTYKGRELSYTSARCADGLLEAHGEVTFADGTVVAGNVDRSCSVK